MLNSKLFSHAFTNFGFSPTKWKTNTNSLMEHWKINSFHTTFDAHILALKNQFLFTQFLMRGPKNTWASGIYLAMGLHKCCKDNVSSNGMMDRF